MRVDSDHMALGWRGVLVAGLAVSVFGAVGGNLGPLARAVTAAMFIYCAASTVRGDPARTRPWRILLSAAVLSVAAGATRALDSAATAESLPLFGIADGFAFASYALLIIGGGDFIRQRLGSERNAADFVDSVIAVLASSLIIYRIFLAEHLAMVDVPLVVRTTNVAYSLLTMVMIGVVFRISFGPGIRNGSYYLLAATCGGVVANDLLHMWGTAGSELAGEVAAVVAPAAFALAAASVRHPGAVQLTDWQPYREQRLTSKRAVLFLGALAAGPLILVNPSWRASTTEVLVTAVVASLITLAVFARMSLVVLDRERSARREHTLRSLAARYPAMASPAHIIDATLEASERLLNDGSKTAAGFFQLDESVIGAPNVARRVARRCPPGLSQPGELSGAALELVRPVLDSRQAAPIADWRTGYAIAAPVERRAGRTEFLLATSSIPLNTESVRNLSSVASQLGLALDAWAATEQDYQQRSDRRFRALVENSSDLLFVVDEDHHITFVSSSIDRLLSIDEESVVGLAMGDLVYDADRGQIRRLLARAIGEGSDVESIEARLLDVDGAARWFEMEARDLREDDEVLGVVVTARDIRDRRTAEANLLRSEARFRLMVQHSHDVVAVVSDDNIITYVSPSIERILAVPIENVLGRSVFEMLSVTESERVKAELGGGASTGIFEVFVQGGDGLVHALEVRATDMREQPEVGGIVLAMRDVTERKSLESDLLHRALHDDLTGMANRAAFLTNVGTAIESAQENTDGAACVVFIDLDGFKLINDSLGHAAGDQVLVAVADRIQETLRTSDVAARLGGDEFAVLLPRIAGLHEAAAVAERIRSALIQPLHIDLHKLSVTASIGIAVLDNEGLQTAEDLLRAADLAMYKAKEAGKDRWDVFEENLEVNAADELFLRAALRRAIDEEEFVLFYQPIVNLDTGEICGVEALVRWHDPQRGLVLPGGFIPAAEEWGLIGQIGRWVAEQATRDLAEWRMSGHELYCSINVSARQLAEPSFGPDFVDLVASHVDPGSVVVELTESVLAGQFTRQTFEHFADHGIRVALDDFGTGYSALSYLQSFPIDMIKIDRAFVNRLGDTSDPRLVQAIQDVAQSIDAVTVAEGIEDPREMALLRGLGIGMGQGFGLTRPVDASTLTKLLSDPRTDWAAGNDYESVR